MEKSLNETKQRRKNEVLLANVVLRLSESNFNFFLWEWEFIVAKPMYHRFLAPGLDLEYPVEFNSLISYRR